MNILDLFEEDDEIGIRNPAAAQALKKARSQYSGVADNDLEAFIAMMQDEQGKQDSQIDSQYHVNNDQEDEITDNDVDIEELERRVQALEKSNHTESVEEDGVSEDPFIDAISRPLDYVGRKLKVKTTKHRPSGDEAPSWAHFMAQTAEGAWHWLANKSEIIGNGDSYFPNAGQTEFSGFVSAPNHWQRSLMPVNDRNESIVNNDQALNEYYAQEGMTLQEILDTVIPDYKEFAGMLSDIGFGPKAQRAYREVAMQFNAIESQLKANGDMEINNSELIEEIEANTWYLETSDGFDSEEDFINDVIPSMQDMADLLSEITPDMANDNLDETLNEAPAAANFTADDLQALNGIRDLGTLKARAMELIGNASGSRPMKPEKVAWFQRAVQAKKSPASLIKMMWDLLLSGEGHGVKGTRFSTDKNSYRKAFGESELKKIGYKMKIKEMQNTKANQLFETTLRVITKVTTLLERQNDDGSFDFPSAGSADRADLQKFKGKGINRDSGHGIFQRKINMNNVTAETASEIWRLMIKELKTADLNPGQKKAGLNSLVELARVAVAKEYKLNPPIERVPYVHNALNNKQFA